ncbi:MAG: hypothetical protein E6R08_00555 [Nevskiaceae bacterium]|nr:MAG: hypothetical protein E6R08_00555 [Nevskiaceae bacterium]
MDDDNELETADRTYQDYHLVTCGDGKIEGSTSTNDPEDRGYPSGFDQWEVTYRDYAQMKKNTGLSHTGVNGCKVNVYLDGARV